MSILRLAGWFFLGALASLHALPVEAQIVSPGRLSASHAELEGVRTCTACHQLRRAGVDGDRCLDCHEPLARRIAEGTGYHATLNERDCGACHKEHLGREGALVRFDTASFRHERVGFELRGAHVDLACQGCHQPDLITATDVRSFDGRPGFLGRTLLGLPTACRACHRADSPHGDQFEGRGCDACHGEVEWEDPPRFDHDEAPFRLTGAHRQVACADCHTRAGAGDDVGLRYTGTGHASCAACHSDPHGPAMAGACDDCHTTEDWHRVTQDAVDRGFDHDRTGFPLTGGHRGLECAACHQESAGNGIRIRFVPETERSRYPRPRAGSCGACHRDPHRGELHGGCDACHDVTGWVPTTYDIPRHASTAFPLEGAHAAVPCGECHAREAGASPGSTGSRFRFALNTDCRACHAEHDPHDDAFGSADCGECHVASSFRVASFDHRRAGDLACRSCHTDDDPHGNQFRARACDDCHEVETFRIAAFDHDRTRFPLEGTHAEAACAGCHRAEPGAAASPVIRYRPIATTCRGCHAESR